MGIPVLWQILRKHGLVHELGGDSPERVVDVAEVVAGQVVALDLSMWLMQGLHQPQLASTYGRSGAPLKVVFDRAVNMLRFGVLPICVLEGDTPQAKQALLDARHAAAHGAARPAGARGASNAAYRALQAKAHALLTALGCPVVQAPGEGEATCAALNAAGYADAVVSSDADALLFGATRVYSSLQLLVNQPRSCTLARCEATEVASLLGLERGGEEALRVAALLVGGDYEKKGARAVGGEMTLQLLQMLCGGRVPPASAQDDRGLFEDVLAKLQQPPSTDLAALSAKGCTGCKVCGHECGTKTGRHTSRNPCCECEGQCVASGKGCQCAFHRQTVERWVDKTVRRAQQSRGFLDQARAAFEEYAAQAAKASKAAADAMQALGVLPGGRPTWRRPDVAALHAAQAGWLGDADVQQLRRKVLPLLLEWDAAHPSEGAAQFALVSVQRMIKHGDQQRSWRAVGTWKRMADADAASLDDAAEDEAWLKEAALKTPESLSVQVRVLQELHPALLRDVQAREQSEAVVREARRKHGAKAAALAKAATAKGQTTLTSMFRVARQGVVGKSPAAAPRTPEGQGRAPSDKVTNVVAEDVAARSHVEVIDLCTPDKEDGSPAKKVKTPPRAVPAALGAGKKGVQRTMLKMGRKSGECDD